MYYTDSHIHLQDYNLQDVKNVVTNAKKNNISAFVTVSARPTDWQKIAVLVQSYPNITPAFGIHPWYINEIKPDTLTELENFLQKFPQAFVGECGIDRLNNTDTETQKKFLLPQIELADYYKRSLIIHAVHADDIFAGILKKLPPRTVFHSYSGNLQWGKQIFRQGFYVGLNPAILRKKNYARIIADVPLQQMLLESDAPYQSKTEDITKLAQIVAQIHNISVSELLSVLYRNQIVFKGE